MFKNKRGDIAIVLLVFMVLLVCSAALFMFVISNSSYGKKIANIGLVNELYSEKISLEYSMTVTAREIIQKNPEVSKEEFLRLFKKEYSISSYKQDLSEEIFSQIENNDYEIKIENNQLDFKLKDLIFTKRFETFSSQDITSAKYKTEISFKIPIR
jgi:hypothetical protein